MYKQVTKGHVKYGTKRIRKGHVPRKQEVSEIEMYRYGRLYPISKRKVDKKRKRKKRRIYYEESYENDMTLMFDVM